VDVSELQFKLRQFAAERDWEQFHNPKNLSMALVAEAGELAEVFQWLTEEQSIEISQDARKLTRAREEMADVLIYLLRLADKLNLDLELAIVEKIQKNAEKYPIHLSKGNSIKYSEFGKDPR
jgi:NTP pyrophosphatase (non-canonical NTP hydrolase)